MTANQALARLERLSYWYPGDIPALVDVRLDLQAGLTVVAGPSGGGKSSLLRVFNGLVPHFHGGRISGGVNVFGHDVLATPTRALARDVGFVFQDPEKQVVYGTVEREVAFGLENLGFERPEMIHRVGEALERLGLDALRGRSVANLSGGERQRVAIASVLAMGPRLVVLDEPTSELDRGGAAAVISACLDLVADGTGVLIAEHRLERLLPVADRLVVVDDGRATRNAPIPAVDPAGDRLVPDRRPGAPIAWSIDDLVAGPAAIPLVESGELVGRSGEVTAIVGDERQRQDDPPADAGRTAPADLRVGRAERRPDRLPAPGPGRPAPPTDPPGRGRLDPRAGRPASRPVAGVEDAARACLAEFGLAPAGRTRPARPERRRTPAWGARGDPGRRAADRPARRADPGHGRAGPAGAGRCPAPSAGRRLLDRRSRPTTSGSWPRWPARMVEIANGLVRDVPFPSGTEAAPGAVELALAPAMTFAALLGASIVGGLLFLLPYLGIEPPGGAITASAALGTVVAFGAIELGARRLDAKGIALLAALAALAAAMRLALVTGLAGFSPFFLLVLCAGYAFGPSYGFLTGAVAMLVSAIVTGGLGPWLPYQMFAAAWVGMGAGILGSLVNGGAIRRPTRRDILILAGYGIVAGFAYGAVMDLWDWAFFQGAPDVGYVAGLGLAGTTARFGQFYLLTSAAYDAFRAVGNAAMVLALGPAVLASLARLRARATFQFVRRTEPGPATIRPVG